MAKGIITEEEIGLARGCVAKILSCGAKDCRVTMNKTVQNSICILDGEVDRISYSVERSLYFHIFTDKRYGTFSTNRLEPEELESFIREAVALTRMLAVDGCRSLPRPDLKASGITEGDELGLVDAHYHKISQDEKIKKALQASVIAEGEGWRLESEDNEYYDSFDDNFYVDSSGWEGRHSETYYGFCSEITVSGPDGNKHSGYHWDGSPFYARLDIADVCPTAARNAIRQIGGERIESGKYDIIVDRCCASRLVSPLLNALDGQCIQQNNSFLKDSLGEMVFGSRFTLTDRATTPGKPGSRLFDSEGVATKDRVIVGDGVVKAYFINSYIANKTGAEPTVEGISRPCIEPFACNCGKKEINLKDILKACPDGLYITGFNGGNCNQATGDFSYGIEGVRVRGGRLEQPFSEVLMTGNMKGLWSALTAAGSDVRECARWQIPTLAFKDIDINA